MDIIHSGAEGIQSFLFSPEMYCIIGLDDFSEQIWTPRMKWGVKIYLWGYDKGTG